MCLGGHQGLRSLAFCVLVFSQQILAFAPAGIQAGFEASVAAGLINNGVEEQSAREQAKQVSEWAFGNEEEGRKGRYSAESDNSKVSLKELFSSGVADRLDFETLSGEKGVLYNVYEHGTAEDRKTLEHLYKEVLPDSKGLFFKTSKRKGVVLDKLNDTRYDTFFAVAPEWFGSTGAAIYRSAFKVNQDGDYLYSNSPEAMMYGFYHMTNYDFADKSIEVDMGHSYDLGRNVTATVFNERFAFCEPGGDYSCDVVGNSRFEFEVDSFTRGTLKSIYARSVGETTPREIDELDERLREESKEPIEDSQGNVTGYTYPGYDVKNLAEAITENTESKMNTDHSVVQQFEAVIVKLRDDVLNSESLKFDKNASPDEEIDTFSTPDGVTDREADSFVLRSDSLKKIYGGILKDYKKLAGSVPSGGSGGGASSPVVPKSSQDLFSSDNFFDTPSFEGASRPSLSAFGDRKQKGYEEMDKPPAGAINISYDEYKQRGAVIPDRGKDRERPVLPGGTGTVLDPIGGTGTGTSPGNGSGTNTGGSTAGGTGSGSASGTGAGTGTGTGAGTNAGTVVGGNTNTKDQEAAGSLDTPILQEMTGREILQPLLDLRNDLLDGLNFSNPSGTCPTATFDAFQKSYSIEAHCIVFDKVSSAISAFMLAIWAILGFRIVFSA